MALFPTKNSQAKLEPKNKGGVIASQSTIENTIF
jgi:hypothetical protein